MHVVALAGEIDIASGPAFEAGVEQAVSAGPGPVLIDMGGVEFMDSTGLRVLIGAFQGLRREDRRLAVCARAFPVIDVLRVSAIDKLIGVHPTPEAALAALAD